MEIEYKIAIIGLGYVGLPLAVEFAKKYSVVGFDINNSRIDELNIGHDRTLEVNNHDLKNVLTHDPDQIGIICTEKLEDIASCNVYIITVPTPTDGNLNPDLRPLLTASETVAKVLGVSNYVIYESTVYPGATEEDCVPILEKVSGLKYNTDFFCGYSPERINPGDKLHTVSKIVKVTSGSTPEAAEKIDQLYNSVIEAGTYKASSIRVAEAAKVIENTQRDINIAFVNELAIIFNKLKIDTQDVLDAASTKWNFLPFKPGLVGGHCIGVDPYYLAQRAQRAGYYPQMILSGRRLNNGMGTYIAKQFIKLLIQHNQAIKNAQVLLLGITFKENCPDIRNSKVITIYNELVDYGISIDVCDTWANSDEVKNEFNIELKEISQIDFNMYSGILLAVAHDDFQEVIPKTLSNSIPVYDVKSFLPKDMVTSRL
jgi:UDP-N-acetyl-D-galactosamine dehydrogenase